MFHCCGAVCVESMRLRCRLVNHVILTRQVISMTTPLTGVQCGLLSAILWKKVRCWQFDYENGYEYL